MHTNIQNNFLEASDLILKSWQPAHFLDVQMQIYTFQLISKKLSTQTLHHHRTAGHAKSAHLLGYTYITVIQSQKLGQLYLNLDYLTHVFKKNSDYGIDYRQTMAIYLLR